VEAILKKDKLLIAAVIGGFSTLAGELVTKLLVLLGIGNYAVYELNSLIVTSDKPSFFMGFVLNFIVGCYVSAIFFLLFKKLGDDHLVIKCAIGSLIIWLLFEVSFTFMIEGQYIPLRPVLDHYVHVLGTLFFGVADGLLLRAFIFKRNKHGGEVP
jgi:hypothetical protein